ncbi:MAG TPA: GNAT family N-acetyltransferase [Acidimicrobiales bacterium]|nr:GNAT family N-acetyltransferase [Acidimicrobiales bacterium]
MTGTWPEEVVVDDVDALVLRAPDPIDAEALTAAVNSSLDHLGAFLDWAKEPTTVDAQAVRLAIAAEAFAVGGDAAYSIFRGDDLVGALGLHWRLGPDALEIGYWLRADHEGIGIITRSVHAALDVAFDVEGVRRVVIHCRPDNARSAAVPRRLGFVRTATQPRQRWEYHRPAAP